ncbi:hypothetical protein BJV82DRAFT_187169 [Fennellomyces sp. T-0311]|nr:hypothetical protein BJV82DRAFT_187169 [Fennellomyces sp. T-0311]
MFKSSLKELYLSDVPCQVFVDQLMRICPKLTHLKLQFDRWVSRQVSMSTDIEPGDGDDAYNLTFLHLDNAFDFNSYLIPLLRRCPKLRVLLVPVNPNRSDGDLYVPRNFGTILRLCPLLRVVLWEVEEDFYNVDPSRIERWFHLTNTVDADDGLLELIFSGTDDDLEPMLPLLTRSQNTLEYLSIHGSGRHMQWNMPETVMFPKMKELLFVLLAVSEEIWVGLMQRCENIEIIKLILNASNTPVNPILQELSTKSRLQFLELIDYSKHHIDPSTEVEYDFSVLDKNTQLDELHISGMCVTNRVLLDLAGILSLRDLYVGVEYHGNCLGLKGLMGFVDKLVAVESGIQSLSFAGCGRINDQVLKRLANVDSLCSLDIKFNAQITDAGVLSFIKANSGREVNVESCLNVSYAGLWNTDSI